MSKITIAVAFGAGYGLGARAGRERYREIKGRASAVWQSDTVQEQASKAQDLAKDQASKAAEAAKDKLPSRLGGKVDGHCGDAANRDRGAVEAAGSHR